MVVREERMRSERNEALELQGTAEARMQEAQMRQIGLREERDQWKRAAEGDRDGLVTHAYHLRVVGALVDERKAIEAAEGVTLERREQILHPGTLK
jgi:hypothetical protein